MNQSHALKARTDERTLYEAQGDTRYSIRYLHLQERLFNRLAGIFKFASLFGGSAAFAGVITTSPVITGTSGLVITASTILDYVVAPERRAMQCLQAKARYQKLLRRSDQYDLPGHDRKAAKIARMPTPHIEGLRKPAYNDASIERGRIDFVVPLSRWERFLHKIA
ncbi:MAG: hypothetical protein ACQEUG_15900 [Pseudomonadota bacterium]